MLYKKYRGKVVGTSLAFCVRDIILSRRKIEDVEMIVAGTKFETVEEVIDTYKETYWKKYSKRAEEVLKALWNEGKIIQPCLENPKALLFVKDIWYENMQELIDSQLRVGHEEIADYLQGIHKLEE